MKSKSQERKAYRFFIKTSGLKKQPDKAFSPGQEKKSYGYGNQSDNVHGRKIWQNSFYDEIIRNEQAYKSIWQYIDDNPTSWAEDKYYVRIPV